MILTNWLKVYDHWSTERMLRHVLYWLAWSTFYVLVNYYSSSCGNHSVWKYMSFELIVLPIKMACAYFFAYILLPYFLFKKRYTQFVIYAIVATFFFGWLLHLLYTNVIFFYLFPKEWSDTELMKSSVFKSVELVYISAAVVGIKFYQNLIGEQQKNRALKREKIEAELKFLRNQVQPHFLFNTLNNIYGMILSGESERAGEALVKLSDILSYLLYESDVEKILLSSEVKNLEDFILLERLRYDRRLDFQYHKSPIPSNLVISPLLLLPFVENAFKHGPAKEEGQSSMGIFIEVDNGTLKFEVRNSYNKPIADRTERRAGIGLENVKKRLKLLYKNKFELDIRQEELFVVTLTIQLETT